jgi:uncharacterized membrane protein
MTWIYVTLLIILIVILILIVLYYIGKRTVQAKEVIMKEYIERTEEIAKEQKKSSKKQRNPNYARVRPLKKDEK